MDMAKLKIYGYPDADALYAVRDFLARSVVDYDWVDLSAAGANGATGANGVADANGAADVNGATGVTGAAGVTNASSALAERVTALRTPDREQYAIEWPDGTWMVNPSVEEMARKLGWIQKPSYAEYDLAIFGAGPAGLSAAVYAASEGLKTVLVERYAIGGQAGSSSLIENYMGFPEGISGAELAERGRQQAQKFGLDILLLREGVKGAFIDDRWHADLADGSSLVSKANICATGIEYRKLNLPREGEFLHKGVYYGGGMSEACFCGGKDIVVVGGGNSAGQAVSYFSGFARNVFMVIRRGNLSDTMSDYLSKRITRIPNVHILFYTEVVELDGDSELRRVRLSDSRQGASRWQEVAKLFICIGGNPNTEWSAGTKILKDSRGYLITGGDLSDCPGFAEQWTRKRQPYSLETSVPGMFAVGDVRHGSVKRVAAAVGEGAMAVSLVHNYLADI